MGVPVKQNKILSLILLACLWAGPSLRGDDCIDDPTISPYLKAVKTDPKNLDHQYNLAIAFYKKADTCVEPAIDAFERFVKIGDGKAEPKSLSDAYSVLGILNYQYKKDNSAAAKWFEKALKISPKDKDSLYGAALAYSSAGDNEKATEYFKMTVAADPKNVNAYYNLAIAMNQSYDEKSATPDQRKELTKVFEGAIKASEGNKKENKDVLIVLYNRVSELYDKAGDVLKAIETLKKAVTLAPEDFNAHSLLGIMYHRDKNYLKMVEEYEKAIAISPDQELARFNLGVAYINQEDFAKSYDQFKYITDKINPSCSECLALQGQTLERAIQEQLNKGTTAFTSEDYLLAKNAFEKVLALNGSNKEAQRYLEESTKKIDSEFNKFLREAKALEKKNKRIDAAAAIDRALALKPGDEEAKKIQGKIGADISQLGKIYQLAGDKAAKTGDYETARNEYLKLQRIPRFKDSAAKKLAQLDLKFKKNLDEAVNEGDGYFKKGDLAKARNSYKRAMAINANDKRASGGLVKTNTQITEQKKKLVARGEDEFGAGKKQDARKTFEKVLALDPNDDKANDFIKRITGTESSAKVNADQVKQLYYKGVDFYVNNQINKAISAWEELLKVDPNHLDAKRNIERARSKLRALEKLKG